MRPRHRSSLPLQRRSDCLLTHMTPAMTGAPAAGSGWWTSVDQECVSSQIGDLATETAAEHGMMHREAVRLNAWC